jgi:hypothetical protein
VPLPACLPACLQVLQQAEQMLLLPGCVAALQLARLMEAHPHLQRMMHEDPAVSCSWLTLGHALDGHKGV